MNGLTKQKAALYLIALFAAGVVVGGTVGFNFGRKQVFRPPRPAQMAAHIQSHLAARLQLTETQTRQISPLISEMVQEMDSVHSNSMCRVGEISQKWHERMALYLTPEQKEKLAEMERERARFFHGPSHGGPPHGHPPPPPGQPPGN